MIENYLQILEESLQKKLDVLKQLVAENKNQEKALKEEKVSFERFEESVDKKETLIEELNRLDRGFEQLYDRIKEQLLQGREQYKEQIARLQALISQITDVSVSIQAQEARNKSIVEQFFADSRKDISKERVRSKAAFDYYNRNSNSVMEPRFMDQKK